jgi:hypothetical protein
MSIFVASTPIDISSQPKYQTFGQMFGQALSGFGWLPQTGHGELANNGLTGTSYAWSGAPIVGASILQPCKYTFRGAWVSGTTYTGIGTTLNNTGVNVVTSGGLTYCHITATSSSATAPASDTTNWAPFNFEIWKNNDAFSSTFPIYLKLAYVISSTANVPAFMYAIGTGVDADGNLTGSVPLNSTAPLDFAKSATGVTLDGSRWNSMFSGDAGNFRFCLFKDKGQAAPSSTATQTLIIDRSCSSASVQNSRDDAFVYIAWSMSFAGGQTTYGSVIMPNPATLTQAVQYDNSRWAGMSCASLTSANGVGAMGHNGGAQTPLLVYPLYGQRPNPQLGLIGTIQGETVDGVILPVWMYGQPHLYLVCAGGNNTGGPTQITSSAYPAILWE